MDHHETAGLELAPPKRKNLPSRVLRAFDNAKHLEPLKRGVRDTLAEICRFVSQARPFDTIFAHKATIAARIGASERTVYRHLDSLKEAGLIEVMPQDRKSRNGRYAVSRIRLTPVAARLLGFVDSEGVAGGPHFSPAPSPSSDSSRVHSDRTAAREAVSPRRSSAEENVIHTQPSAKTAVRHTLTKPTIPKNQPRQLFEHALPKDLAWLTGNGLSRAGIFKLMALSKQHGKLLSDIVVATKERLRTMHGGRLFAYLQALALGPSDFSCAARESRARLVLLEASQRQAERHARFRQRFRSTALVNRSQTRLYCIDANAAYAQVFGGPVPVTVPLTDLTDWVTRIDTGALVLATSDAERKFISC